ncbi:hypothetical protein ACIPPJ_22995 [Streptomyces sp. NPDC086091]|uniref:hypothetical protein n=1 Tax=Streptomyces sp. NPDC086091 TaxID=3365751 RepID=UPI0037FE1700
MEEPDCNEDIVFPAGRDASAFGLSIRTAMTKAEALATLERFELTEDEFREYFPGLAKKVWEVLENLPD